MPIVVINSSGGILYEISPEFNEKEARTIAYRSYFGRIEESYESVKRWTTFIEPITPSSDKCHYVLQLEELEKSQKVAQEID